MRSRLSSLAPGAGLFTALAAVAAAAPLLLHPPGRDQSVFLLGARAMLSGRRLYLDFWDIKPPGLFLAYLPAAPLALLWPGAAALIDLLALAAAVLLAHRLARACGRPGAGLPAGLLLTGLWIFAGDWWDVGQAERLAAPLLMGALLAACRRSPARWLGAGLCLGAMVLLKTSFAVLGLALAPLWLGAEANGPPALRGRLRQAGLAAAGALAPPVLAALALAALGALGAAWGATVGFTSHYTRLAWQQPGVVAETFRITGLAFLAGAWPLMALAAPALAPSRTGTGGDRRLPRALVAALLVALAAGLASIVAQGKFFPYHWIILWAPLALVAGLGADRLAGRWRGAAAPRRGAAAAGLALAAVAGSALSSAPGWPGYAASLQRALGLRSSAEQRSVFRVQGMGMDELARVARQVAEATTPGSPVLLWGFEPAFYLYAGRGFPGRFPFAYPLVTPWAPRDWRDAWLADLQAGPPAAIVVRRGDPIPWVAGVGGDAAARMRLLPGMEPFLTRDYRPRPDLSSRHLQVWLRVAAPPQRR